MSETQVIQLALYIMIGIVSAVLIYISHMKDQDLYLSDIFIILFCLILWPVCLVVLIRGVMVNAENILIWRRK